MFFVETFMYVTDCKCCQTKGHNNIRVRLTCEDRHSFMTEIQVPSACECQACVSGTVSKSTKYGRKISPRLDGRAKLAPESDSYLDDVEFI